MFKLVLPLGKFLGPRKVQSFVFYTHKEPAHLNRHTSLTNIHNTEFRQFQTFEILRFLATT